MSKVLNGTTIGVVTFNGVDDWMGSAVTPNALMIGGSSNSVSSIGLGSPNQLLQSGGSGQNPAWTTATYPNTISPNQLLFAYTGNVIQGLTTANSAILVTSATGVPSLLGSMTNGQLVVGSTGAIPVLATITSGAGISVINGAGTITIASTDAGFTWNDTSGTSATLVKENGYAADNAGLVTFTLPTVASSTFGDTIAIMGFGAGGWTIAQNANQKIIVGGKISTVGVGGSVSSTNQYDAIELACTPNTNFWIARQVVGNLTIV